jgi:hypothetical protein
VADLVVVAANHVQHFRKVSSYNLLSISSSRMTRCVLLHRLKIAHLIILFQSINVMECREFHNLLLLLREDLEEKDIPHQTKLCETIVTAWKSWFVTLKSDLAVGVTYQFL